jgi:hypothetical protein
VTYSSSWLPTVIRITAKLALKVCVPQSGATVLTALVLSMWTKVTWKSLELLPGALSITQLLIPINLEVFLTCFGSSGGPGGAPLLTDGG